MLHFVVSVADKPLIVQRRSVPTPQKVVGLLLVVGNAAELCDGKRTVQREPVLVNQQLLLTIKGESHMSVAIRFSHETYTRVHTGVKRGKGGRIQITASRMNGNEFEYMVMGSVPLIRLVLKKKIGMTNAEKLSDRRDKSIAWSSSYRVSANHRRGKPQHEGHRSISITA